MNDSTSLPMDKKDCENTALLLIGSAGNGKSTLGNFLIDPSKSHMFGEKAKFSMARSNRPETQELSCEEFTHQGRYTFRVIDTPSLNDGAEKDLIHMCSLVKFLNDPNLKGVRACLLCVKFSSKIDAQYKTTVAYYSRLLPSLFEGNVLIIMTEFMTDDRAEKLRKMRGIDVELVKKNTADEIKDSARLTYNPPLFTVDCLPVDKDEREYSLKVRESVLDYILQLSDVRTANLRVEKTDYLKQLDAKEIGRLKGEITGYNKRLMEANGAATEVLTELEKLKLNILDVEGNIANTKNELAVKDSDDLTVANSWNVNRSFKILKTLHETFDIQSKWKIERVTMWKNSPAEWKDVKKEDYKVSGSLQGQWMRGLHASVTLETKKRTKYANEIAKMKEELEELEEKLKALQEEAKEYNQRHIDFQNEIALLNAYIEERKSAIEKLHINSMSVAETMKRVVELQQQFKETSEEKREAAIV